MIYSCPACQSKFQSDVKGVVICPGCGAKVRVDQPVANGCVWDRAGRGEYSTAFFETIKVSLVNPIAFFSEVGAGSGWERPLIYAIVISAVVFASVFAYQLGFQSLAVGLDLSRELGKSLLPIFAVSVPVTVVVAVLFFVIGVPLITVCATLFQAAIYHLCLMILGAARRDFQATYRTVCYSFGPQVFQIVPIVGSIFAPIWALALAIIGIKVVHDTSYARSAIAIFLPMIICCCFVTFVIVAVAGGIAGAIGAAAGH